MTPWEGACLEGQNVRVPAVVKRVNSPWKTIGLLALKSKCRRVACATMKRGHNWREQRTVNFLCTPAQGTALSSGNEILAPPGVLWFCY